MANPPVAPTQFKDAKTQFSAETDETVQTYLDAAEMWVSDDWPSKYYASAVIAVACHLMTLDGKGSGEESKSFASGSSEFQSVRSASVTITRFAASGDNSRTESRKWFAQTACGRFFWQLLAKRAAVLPRIAEGGVRGAYTRASLAKD